jgi:YggT family protein
MCTACLFRVFLEALVNVVSGALTLALFIRVALSWIPGARLPLLGDVVNASTEWILVPIRRVVRPSGGADFSPLVALLLIDGISLVILRLLPPAI